MRSLKIRKNRSTTRAFGILHLLVVFASYQCYSQTLLATLDVTFTGNFSADQLRYDVDISKNGNLMVVSMPYDVTKGNDALSEGSIWIWNQSRSSYTAFNNISHVKVSNYPNITLKVTDGALERTTEIYYILGATTGFDNGYDSTLFESGNFEIYTQLLTDNQGQKLAIQSLPNTNYENMVIPVGIKADSGKNITFKVAMNSIPEGLFVYLEDREKGVFTKFDTSEALYETPLSEALNGTGRFYLHVTTPAALVMENLSGLEGISIYTSLAQRLHVDGVFQDQALVNIYSLLGKELYSISFVGNGSNQLMLPKLSAGVYVVYLKTVKGFTTKKIIMK